MQKRVGEFLILGLYLAIDAAEVWHRSHFWALFAAFIGIVALLLLDGGLYKTANNRNFGTGRNRVHRRLFCCAARIAEETELHGWLEPANEPFPQDFACDTKMLEQVRPNGMLFSWASPVCGLLKSRKVSVRC